MALNLLIRNKKQLLSLASRRLRLPASASSSAKEEVIEVVDQKKLNRLKELQRQFQKDDGVVVWLKGGPRDKILFQFSVGATALMQLYGWWKIFGHIGFRQM